jgi:hypothetical protein
MRTIVDWLPKNHDALYDQANQTRNFLLNPPNRDRMGFAPTTPQGEWLDTEFEPKYQTYDRAFSDWKNPAERTPVRVSLLEAAEKTFKAAFRKLYTGFLKNSPLVGDDDLKEMGLPKRHSGGNTPAPVATTYPDFAVDSSTIRRLGVDFYDHGQKKSKAKPDGQHGAEICWAIRDTPPAALSDLTNSSFDTHTPLVLEFDEPQRGQTVYFCLRWENTRGIKGPWGEIQSAVIP